jgi:hypothetical protein
MLILPGQKQTDKNRDMLRQTGGHTSKGFGRIMKAAVKSPMELSVSFTKGFHNAPKLWGDETVRPQEQVNDFKSGVKAIGKEFGFGLYDGFTGLLTQPWKGAQKEGTSGFLKGVGKGIGGLLTKPSAGLFSIPAYMMKGVHKEVQKLFGSNVQNYIVASRVAQGYDEWLKSSDAERQDVIVQWELIQKHLKKKADSDEVERDVLEAQRKKDLEDGEIQHNGARSMSYAQSANNAGSPTQGPIAPSPANMGLEEWLRAAEISDTTRMSVLEASRGDAEDADVNRTIQQNRSQLQRQQSEAANQQAYQKNMRQTMVSSEAEAYLHASEVLEYERQLKRAVAQSLGEQRQRGRDGECESNMGLDDEEDEERERVTRKSEKMVENAAAVAAGSPDVQQPPLYDQGYLAGITQSEFEAQQQGQRGEKTAQEKTEEEIVIEYVKKQSLLEGYHHNKGKDRATATEDEDDEDLQKALKLSMQGHEYDAGNLYGEAS